jgi:ketosteroid isomerase-like protein
LKGEFMKRVLAVTSIMLAMCTVAFAQGSVENTLMDLERQWVKAALASTGDALAPLLATDFVSVQSDGTTQTKSVYVAMTNKGKWQVSEVSDMKVQVHGDSAVVTGVWTGKGTDGTGKAVDGKERFADTWVKMPDGKWQCVASASAPMK